MDSCNSYLCISYTFPVTDYNTADGYLECNHVGFTKTINQNSVK
jgi:hypothetical protein